MAEIVRLAESLGIRKHKCATIAEAEMVAAAGGTDVLLAYPLVGPEREAVRPARARLPQHDVSRHGRRSRGGTGLVGGRSTDWSAPVPVLVDLEIGMGRTGIVPGEAAAELYALIDRLPNLEADGLHAYDGHIHDSDPAARRQAAQAGLESTLALARQAAQTGPAGTPAGGRRHADVSDPRRARCPRRRVFAGDDACFTTTATARSSRTCRSRRPPCS